MDTKITLESALLQSGTGQLNGFFRLPKGIQLIKYWEYQSDKNALQDAKEKELDEADEIQAGLWNTEKDLGDKLPSYQKQYDNPLINLSNQDGTFLGTYRIIDIDNPGTGESDGEFIITLQTKSGMNICVDTEQINLGGNYGECTMYIDGDGEELLPFKL